MTDVNLTTCGSGSLIWFGDLKGFSKSTCKTHVQPPTLPCLILEPTKYELIFEVEKGRDEFFSALTSAVSSWKNKYIEVIDNQVPSIRPSNQAGEGVRSSSQVTTASPPKIATESIVETKEVSQDGNAAQSVMQLLDYASKDDGNHYETQIQELKQKIDGLPKPAKGERKSARAINEQALSLFNSGKVAESIELFNQASQLDKSDPEILNNLGYALLRNGKLDEAKTAILDALAISPGRSSAWQNLADILTIQGDKARGIKAFENVYRFSKNRTKTYKSMQKLNNTDGSVLKEARQLAMDWAKKMYADENLGVIVQVP